MTVDLVKDKTFKDEEKGEHRTKMSNWMQKAKAQHLPLVLACEKQQLP